jgi:hypothetical protein
MNNRLDEGKLGWGDQLKETCLHSVELWLSTVGDLILGRHLAISLGDIWQFLETFLG